MGHTERHCQLPRCFICGKFGHKKDHVFRDLRKCYQRTLNISWTLRKLRTLRERTARLRKRSLPIRPLQKARISKSKRLGAAIGTKQQSASKGDSPRRNVDYLCHCRADSNTESLHSRESGCKSNHCSPHRLCSSYQQEFLK